MNWFKRKEKTIIIAEDKLKQCMEFCKQINELGFFCTFEFEYSTFYDFVPNYKFYTEQTGIIKATNLDALVKKLPILKEMILLRRTIIHD
jgi:hypothetical protein